MLLMVVVMVAVVVLVVVMVLLLLLLLAVLVVLLPGPFVFFCRGMAAVDSEWVLVCRASTVTHLLRLLGFCLPW
jgi:hypothetical protein